MYANCQLYDVYELSRVPYIRCVIIFDMLRHEGIFIEVDYIEYWGLNWIELNWVG